MASGIQRLTTKSLACGFGAALLLCSFTNLGFANSDDHSSPVTLLPKAMLATSKDSSVKLNSFLYINQSSADHGTGVSLGESGNKKN